MNRHDRRKQKAQAPKCAGTCGTRRMPQLRSDHDGKARCLPCHSQHLQHLKDHPEDRKTMTDTDVQTSLALVRAQQIQEATHKAILSVLPERGIEHNGLIVHALTLTAATFAHQASIGRDDYLAATAAVYDQIGAALSALARATATAQTGSP